MLQHRILAVFFSLLTLACLTACADCGGSHQTSCAAAPGETGIPGGSDGGGGGGGGGGGM